VEQGLAQERRLLGDVEAANAMAVREQQRLEKGLAQERRVMGDIESASTLALRQQRLRDRAVAAAARPAESKTVATLPAMAVAPAAVPGGRQAEPLTRFRALAGAAANLAAPVQAGGVQQSGRWHRHGSRIILVGA
jgi:hypothetical protein